LVPRSARREADFFQTKNAYAVICALKILLSQRVNVKIFLLTRSSAAIYATVLRNIAGLSDMCEINVEIERLIPHRSSMRLIEEIIEIGDSLCTTAATVSPEWPLVEDGHVSPIILIELAAQTAGVSFGWHEHLRGKETGPRPGWLVGIKSAEFFRDKIPLRARIVTTIKDRKRDEVYAEISSTAFMGPDRIAEMTLQVFKAGSE
jgi:predicted hotdog family 3-hydroxylacyl-ACP dehydratase